MDETSVVAFIGGGNMASAIVGGLRRAGQPGERLRIAEPLAEQRLRLEEAHGVRTFATAAEAVQGARLVVWAVKPQAFSEAAEACRGQLAAALHLSVMAGVRSEAIAAAAGTDRVVRAMPNTPALIGRGIAGLYARPSVGNEERRFAEAVLEPTGEVMWFDHEDDLDAVTALSGSGPAYVFYIVEAMMAAAVSMGLSEAQGRRLALATFAGASELALRSEEPPALLRERVTSKGGTTHAAIESLEASGVARAFIAAVRAAQARAAELGRPPDR